MVFSGFKKDIRIGFKIIKSIFLPFNFIFNKILKKLNFFIIWRSGKAIGDQVLMAGFAKLLESKFNSKIIVITNYPSLLNLSPWIKYCVSPKKIKLFYFLYYLLKLSEGERIIEYNFPYKSFGYKSHLEAYSSGFYENIGTPPIWHSHVANRFESNFFDNFKGGLEKSNNNIRANLLINGIRRKHINFKIGIINPIGKDTFTRAKIYGFQNYQRIINSTSNKIKWIQVGKKDDDTLQNIYLDLKGNSLDFLVDIISLSDLVLSDEGLINHIAGSFPKVNSYVIFSGFCPEIYYSYQNTITIGKPKNLDKINYWTKEASKINKKQSPVKLGKIILDNEFQIT